MISSRGLKQIGEKEFRNSNEEELQGEKENYFKSNSDLSSQNEKEET